ncbi:MAG: MgtC/SapB family protein [Candidatus Ventricola sp.]
MTWWDMCIRLVVAVTVGCIIGIERERKNRPAGMRTHVLVCVGAATIAILESMLIHDTVSLNAMNERTGIAVSVGRISAQVVSGIGFLGAGTIFVSQKKIAGLTTAASLWNVACLGLAAGMGYYKLALAGCCVVIVTLMFMQRMVHVNAIKNVEVKFIHRKETLAFINAYFEEANIKVLDVDFHVENNQDYNLYTNLYTLHLPDRTTYTDIVNHLSEHANVQSVRTRNV